MNDIPTILKSAFGRLITSGSQIELKSALKADLLLRLVSDQS